MEIALIVLGVINLLMLLFLARSGMKNKGHEELSKEVRRLREETLQWGQVTRSELMGSVRDGHAMMSRSVLDSSQLLQQQMEALTQRIGSVSQGNEERLDRLRESVQQQLLAIQQENAKQMEQMRSVVDEKLDKTLQTRLDASFDLVSKRLEAVYKGLGEMQSLSVGVNELKRVLTNVKTRGTWGEVQMGALLEQVLSADQYATNVAVNPQSAERVEYAVKMPGQGEDTVWLPMDAKFPVEDYQRLMDAVDAGDKLAAEAASKALEARIKEEAKKIHTKYICPPHTTDFAILFLPAEGLYAEVLRIPGLADYLQNHFRVSIAGPTTLAALLNSLQMGFRTLAIQKRSSEVWKLLGAVKGDFAKFYDLLEKTQKSILAAAGNIEKANKRTQIIQRKLRDVEELPDAGEVSLDLDMEDQLKIS